MMISATRGEFEQMTLARVLIASSKGDRSADCLDEAMRLLGRLLQAAESGGRLGSAIQILYPCKLLCLGRKVTSPCSLHRWNAGALAEPEGYTCTFVNEGEAMRLLLEAQARARPSARRLCGQTSRRFCRSGGRTQSGNQPSKTKFGRASS